MVLREVGAAVERGQVARQRQLAGGEDRVAVRSLGRSTPADHQIADAADGRGCRLHLARLDQDLGASAGPPAVVSDLTAHHDRGAGERRRTKMRHRIDRWQLRAADRQEGGRDGERDQGGPQEQRQQHAPDGGRDGRRAEHRLFGSQDNSCSQRS